MTDPLRPVLSLFAAVSAAHHAAQRLLEARLPKGVSGAQFAVLDRLARLGEGQTPISVAQAFGWPKTSMSHTVAVMEARGLVRLEPNPRDGRSKCLWLTPKGRTLRGVAITALEPDLAALGRSVTEESLAPLRQALFALRAAMEAVRGD